LFQSLGEHAEDADAEGATEAVVEDVEVVQIHDE